jgi:hypothetical protein
VSSTRPRAGRGKTAACLELELAMAADLRKRGWCLLDLVLWIELQATACLREKRMEAERCPAKREQRGEKEIDLITCAACLRKEEVVEQLLHGEEEAVAAGYFGGLEEQRRKEFKLLAFASP